MACNDWFGLLDMEETWEEGAVMANVPEKPKTPCPCCHCYEWYLPGDYFYGKKVWLCNVCQPGPLKGENK